MASSALAGAKRARLAAGLAAEPHGGWLDDGGRWVGRWWMVNSQSGGDHQMVNTLLIFNQHGICLDG